MKRLLTLLMAVLLLLTGCGAGKNSEEPELGWDEYQQQQQQQEEAPPELPEDFSLAYHKDHTLSPFTCGEGLQQDVASLLYEPLFRLDEAFEPVPLLCESWSVDESGLVWTLTIRRGVPFSDGAELTAADAAASLRYAAGTQRYGYRLRRVASVTSNRDNQVILTLSQPDSALPALLDIPVVKRGTEEQLVPTGTGPYVFVTGSESSYLQANPDWWQQKALPVSSIPLVHVKDQDTAMYFFSSRRVELLTVDPTGNQIPASGQRTETDRPTTVLQFIGFNTLSGVFADSAARAAFSRGLQREMLTDAFLSGHAQAAQFPISPLSPLYPAELEKAYSYDAALEALAAAGQDSGETTELTLLVNEEDSFRLSGAKFIAESMSLLNWRITVRALPWEEYLLALANGEFDLYCGEVRLTADWDLTDLIGTGGALNYGGYTSAVTDALLSSFAAAENRQEAAYELCKHLSGAVPIAPICFRSFVVLTHPGVVENLTPAPGNTFYGMENWKVCLK